MTELKVDYHALSDMATKLARTKSALDGTKDTVFGHDGDLGSSHLRDAMHTFVDKWSQGRQQITDDCTQAIGFLNGAVEAYTQNEQQHSQEYAGSDGGDGSTGAP